MKPFRSGASSGDRGASPLLLWLALTVAFGGTALVAFQPHTYLKGDSAFYITMQRALMDSGWLEMSAYHPMSWYTGELPHYAEMDKAWSNLSLGADGKSYYPKHPWLIALLALPLYALGGPVGSLLFNIMGMAALLAAGYAIARRLCGPGAAIAGLLPAALSALVLDNVYTVSNDVFYSALIGLGLVAMLGRRFVVSALMLALAVVAKPTNILWLPVPFVALGVSLWREAGGRPHWRVVARALWGPVVAVAVVGGIAATMNTLMFGAPWRTSYHTIVVAHRGEISLESAAAAFNRPFWSGLIDQFTNRWQGLWPSGLALMLGAVLGAVGLVRGRLAGLACTAAFVGCLLLHARYDYVWSRFYLPVMVLVPLGIAAPLAGRVPRVRPLPDERHLLLGLLAAAIAGLMLTLGAAALSGPGAVHALDERLEEARVFRRSGPQSTEIPCDYLNPNTMHWECSRLEPAWWQSWGRDIRGECVFSTVDGGGPVGNLSRHLLLLHPAPVPIAKRIVWQDLGALSGLRLHVGYAASSRATDADIEVFLNDQPVSLPALKRSGVLYSLDLDAAVQGKTATKLEVRVKASGDHEWRQLCLGAELTRDGR